VSAWLFIGTLCRILNLVLMISRFYSRCCHGLHSYHHCLIYRLGTTQPEGDEQLKLQLSSPIEEAVLTAENKYTASFRGVETGQATLSITTCTAAAGANNEESTTTIDVAEFTHQQLNALDPADKYETEKDIFGKRLKLTYVPSPKDQREELYELLNKATQHKATAREDLRQAAANMPSSSSTVATTSSSSGRTPAVQAGFLNKKSAAAPSKWKIWFQRGVAIVPVAKNYVLFVGFLFFSHFQGQNLAIPAPV